MISQSQQLFSGGVLQSQSQSQLEADVVVFSSEPVPAFSVSQLQEQASLFFWSLSVSQLHEQVVEFWGVGFVGREF